jgi:hypothetical protein
MLTSFLVEALDPMVLRLAESLAVFHAGSLKTQFRVQRSVFKDNQFCGSRFCA